MNQPPVPDEGGTKARAIYDYEASEYDKHPLSTVTQVVVSKVARVPLIVSTLVVVSQ